MFLVHASDDPISEPDHSVTMYLAMKRAGFRLSYICMPPGGMVLGVRKVDHPCVTWTDRLRIGCAIRGYSTGAQGMRLKDTKTRADKMSTPPF